MIWSVEKSVFSQKNVNYESNALTFDHPNKGHGFKSTARRSWESVFNQFLGLTQAMWGKLGSQFG